MTLPSTTGNDLYGLHFRVSIPASRTWTLNDESLGDIIEGIMAVGLNRQDGSCAHWAALRMAKAFERSMQLLYALAVRAPHVVRNVKCLEDAMQDSIRQR